MPRKPKLVPLLALVPQSVKERLQGTARREKSSLGRIIRMILSDWLSKQTEVIHDGNEKNQE